MKNNKITMEMAQERVNELYGDQPFTIKKWDGSKKQVTISYGRYNPVRITIDRGEYLYRADMMNHVMSKVYNHVQEHLDEQGKKMTLIHISGENKPAIAVCQCCGKTLTFSSGKKITSKHNGCIQEKLFHENKEKLLFVQMAMEGIFATGKEEELCEMLNIIKLDQEFYTVLIKQYETRVKNTKKEIKQNRKFIKEYGIHAYFINKYESSHSYFEEWDEDEMCA